MATAEAHLPPGGVVDAHTHAFPPEVVGKRESYLRRDAWFGLLYAEPRARLVVGDEVVATMDAAGIAQSVLCGFPWRDPGLCREHNDSMAAAARASRGRLAWLGIVSPALDPGAAMEAERCFELGAAGLGELNADAQGFDLREPAPLAPVVEVCLAHDRPAMLHATEPVGHAYLGKGTATPDRLLAFLAAFPALRVVLAHWGGGLPFYELMPEVAAAAARVAYDSAASTYLYRPQVFRAVLDVVGPDRVLFASDHPILRQDKFLRRVLASAALRPDETAAVLGGTARRVYGLPSPESAGNRG